MDTPNLRTIAERAGVSVSSVSNAFNRPDQLSAVVRERILATARELGYAGPHPAARSLRTRHVGAIGVLFSTPLEYAFADPYCVELMRGMSEVMAEHRTDLLLIPQADTESAQRAVVDGVIADGLDEDAPAIQAVLDRGLPVALSTDSTVGGCAVIDDRAAGRLIGEHLAVHNLRHVTVVVGTSEPQGTVTVGIDESTLYAYSRLRVAGIRDGLGANVTVVGVGGNSIASGVVAGEAILSSGSKPGAIAADSDVLAVGVAQAIRRHGLTLGEDVAVTGFDDVDIAADAHITTVRQPIREKGRVLARLLLDPKGTQRRTVLDTVLVPRASTTRAEGEPAPTRHSGEETTRASAKGTLWSVEGLDVEAYFDRIGYQGPPVANLATLQALHRAHIASIPFENLDLMLGQDISVGLAAIQQKLVYRKRGGYCYEQNLLMAAALEKLGYSVTRLLARVGDPEEGPRPRSHLILTVQIEGHQWLVDVGFGSGLLEPIPLTPRGAISQGVWTFEITRGLDGAWRLRELRAGKWTTRYSFMEERIFPVDVEGANFNTATSAKSPFVQRPILVGRDEYVEKALIGRDFKTADAEQELSHELISNDHIGGVLNDNFGLRLGQEEIDALTERLG